MPIRKAVPLKHVFPDLDKSRVRVLTVKTAVSATPLTDFEGQWVALESPQAADATTVGSYFALHLLQDL